MRLNNHVRILCGFGLMACLAVGQAQTPVVGMIDYYGFGKASRDNVRKALDVKEGGPLPSSKADTEERIDKVNGIVESHLEAVCCNGGKVILYVGVLERGAPYFDVRETPEGEARLPGEVAKAYSLFHEAVNKATRQGNAGEDLTQGYSLLADADARELQESFKTLSKTYAGDLRDVLRNSYDEEQRAAAAYLLTYGADRKVAVNDAQFALRDADPGVRGLAAKALLAQAVYARLHPDSEVKIEATWFAEMLNSLAWSDRKHALDVLQILTETREKASLDLLRERSLSALIEMARWKTLEHALPAFVLLGRMASLSETQIQDSWNKGDRELVITLLGGKKAR